MMTAEEYAALKEDIAKHGLREAIWVHDGKIIDGRNRWNACQELNMTPRFREWDGNGSLVAFIVTMNLHRRHLTSSQRAMVAVDMLPYLEEEAKARQGMRTDLTSLHLCSDVEFGEAAEHAAKQAQVSPRYVYEAQKLLDEAPDMAEQVRDGDITITQAKKYVRECKQREDAKRYSEQVASLPPLQKEYNIIYTDVPWAYGGHEYKDAEANKHYATMTVDEICTYLQKIQLRIKDNAVLFFWATNPHLEHALEVIKAWGFDYKTNIVWVKTQLKKPGVGFYVRGRHELLLICIRGSFTPLDKNISPPIGSVMYAPIGEHSEKPQEAYEIIERLYPNCTYIELFARRKRPGWDCLGLESHE